MDVIGKRKTNFFEHFKRGPTSTNNNHGSGRWKGKKNGRGKIKISWLQNIKTPTGVIKVEAELLVARSPFVKL